MPTNLDHLFATLGQQADTVLLAGPETARRRGRQRRREQLGAAAVVLLVLLAAATAGMLRLTRPVPPAAPTVHFTALTKLGDPVPFLRDLPGATLTGFRDVAIVIDHAVDEHVRVRALDYNTGRVTWSIDDLGDWDDGVVTGEIPDGVLVSVQKRSQAGVTVALYSVDRGTGRIRWRTDDVTREADVAAGDPLVVRDARSNELLGLDLGTGAVRWRSPTPPNASIVPTLSTALYRYDPDGTLVALDNQTGEARRTWPTLLPPFDPTHRPVLSIIGDRLFKFPSGQPGTVVPVDWVDLDAPTAAFTRLFTPPGPGRPWITACGPDQLCLAEGERLSVVDASTGALRWSGPTGSGGSVTAADCCWWGGAYARGERIVTWAGRLFDLGGRLVYAPPAPEEREGYSQGGFAGEGAILVQVFHSLYPAPRQPVDVIGVSTVDGTAHPLGTMPPLFGACAWNSHTLICPHEGSVQAYRFAD